MATRTSAKSAAASKKVEVSADKAAFDKIVSRLAASTKKGVVEDLLNSKVEVIPTGMLGLDIATGVGGFPVGRIVELYGMESCGKSTTLYHLTREAQKLGYIPIMIETEGSIDKRYLKRIGVDISNIVVFSPDSMESAIDFIVEASRAVADDNKRALIMLDSVAALAPEVMMEESAEKKFRATQASVWSAQMPKLISVLRATSTTLVLVNQMREGMDLYAPPTTPGGKAIKFAASLRVLMRRKVEKDPNKDAIDGILGQEINFIIEKNKMASPGRKGFAYLPANGRVDLAQDVLARGIERGLIKKDEKYEDGEVFAKKNYFTIVPDERIAVAIRKDIARAEKANAPLPGTAANGPHMKADEPFSVYYEKTLLEVFDFAPNLVAALKEEILETLAAEADFIDEDPFEAALRESAKAFDESAEDGARTEDITASMAADQVAHAAEQAAAEASAEAASEEASDDDLAEFATK